MHFLLSKHLCHPTLPSPQEVAAMPQHFPPQPIPSHLTQTRFYIHPHPSQTPTLPVDRGTFLLDLSVIIGSTRLLQLPADVVLVQFPQVTKCELLGKVLQTRNTCTHMSNSTIILHQNCYSQGSYSVVEVRFKNFFFPPGINLKPIIK